MKIIFHKFTTACGHRIAHRKWKETKLQPGIAGLGNRLGSCLVSFHFLWAILCLKSRCMDLGRRSKPSSSSLSNSPLLLHTHVWGSGRRRCEGDWRCENARRGKDRKFCLPHSPMLVERGEGGRRVKDTTHDMSTDAIHAVGQAYKTNADSSCMRVGAWRRKLKKDPFILTLHSL